MKKRNLALLIALLAVVAGAIAVAAVSPDVEVMRILKGAFTPAQLNLLLEHRQAHQAEMKAHLADRPDPVQLWRDLALTEDQQDKLLDVAATNVDELALAGQHLQADGAALRRAVFTGDPANPGIAAAAGQFGADLGDAAVLAAAALREARAALTPAQVKKLDDARAKHDAHLREFVDTMPDRVDELVDLWNRLALSPRQMDALQEIHRVMPKKMRQHRKEEREQFRADLAAILTPAQQKVADDFHARMMAEHERHGGPEGRGAERQKFETELALTGSQRISLVNMVIARRDGLENSALLLVAAGLDLRDQVLAVAPDEAAIRASAARFAEILGQAASTVGVQLVVDARKILTPKQWTLVARELDRHDLRAARHIGDIPARVHGLIAFSDRLALTPAQKAAITDLIEKRHAERRARFLAREN